MEIEKQALLAQSGKISELIVHGIGPIPFRIDKQVVYSIMIICFLIINYYLGLPGENVNR